MVRLAADLAETFKEGQGGGQATAKQGDLLPSGHPSSPLTIVNECFFVEMLNFVSKGVDI